MNLEQARQELYDRGFSYLSAARANQMLEDAQQQLNDVSSWPWLRTTTTGTGTVTIADLRDILYVLDTTNENALWPADVRDLAEIDPVFSTTTGTPTNYYLADDVVTPYPSSANVALTVGYVKVPVGLTNGTDTPSFPTRLQKTWVDLAVIRAYLDRDNFDAAQALQATVDNDLQRAQENLIAQSLDHPPQQTVVEQNC